MHMADALAAPAAAAMYAASGAAAGVSVRALRRDEKLRYILLLVCAVGVCNPFFDRAPLLTVGGIAVSGGGVFMAALVWAVFFAAARLWDLPGLLGLLPGQGVTVDGLAVRKESLRVSAKSWALSSRTRLTSCSCPRCWRI